MSCFYFLTYLGWLIDVSDQDQSQIPFLFIQGWLIANKLLQQWLDLPVTKVKNHIVSQKIFETIKSTLMGTVNG